MKVKLLVSRCGPNVMQNAGDEIEVSSAEGKRMMESEPPQCVPVRSSKAKVEKATKK